MFSDCGPSGFFNPQQFSNNHQTGFQRRQQTNEPRKTKVFTPVTVRMVMNAQPRPDDVCEFEGDPINDIILTGRLIRRMEEPMRTQFEINDNTGTFFVLFYHKGENQIPTALRNFQYEQFCYAKIYGNIRVFKEEKAIVGTHIKRIDKFDEMTNHFLATYVAHCIRKKGVLKPRELAIETSVDQMQMPNNNHATEVVHTEINLRQTILQVMKELLKTNKFVEKANVFCILQTKIDRAAFDKELESMLADGVISQGYDSNTFCLVD